MPLVRGDEIVEDPWVYAGWLAEAPDDAPVILPLDLWESERAAIDKRDAAVGVLLHPDDDPERLAGGIGTLGLVALEFPAFADGRAFSQARLLRERLGFTGELRAIGPVIVDQKQFLRRCGFDTVELPDDQAVKAWVEARSPVELYYQPAADRADTPLQRLRKARAAG